MRNKKLSKKLTKKNQKMKKHCKKFGHSPLRPRKVSALEILEVQLQDIQDSTRDLLKMITGKSLTPWAKRITGRKVGDMLFPIKPKKQKVIEMKSPLHQRISLIGSIMVSSIMSRACCRD